MGKLCCVFNIPSLYREAIYLAIDKKYDCEWYFENEKIDITLFDIGQLKKAKTLEHGSFFLRFYRMKGLTRLLWNRKDIDEYLMLGSPMCVSIWSLCLLLKLFHPKKRIYFWTHGWYGKESFMERTIKKPFLKLANELFIYGNYAKELLVKKGFKADIIHVIHNSLSYDVQIKLRKQMSPSFVYKEHFGNNNPVLIFIGRLTTIKKLDLLLEAVASLRHNNHLYNVVFVGDGVEREDLERRVAELDLCSQVWFYGACYDEKVNAELIYNADLCVAPGNIGLTAIHVLTFGCPAITHSDFAYQMPEFEAIKPNETGDFFERGSAESLANTISDWFRVNGLLRDSVRTQCFKEIDSFWNPEYQMQVISSVIE